MVYTYGGNDEEVWTSSLHINKSIEVVIPGHILSICNYLKSTIGSLEFSILCKGTYKPNTNKFVISREYALPKQEVDGCSVYYNNDDLHKYRSEGFNVVIHCHPFTSSSFSNTDDTTINCNFDCSILYSEGNFTTAIIPITVCSGFVLQVTPKITIDWSTAIDNATLNAQIQENITKKAYAQSYNKYGSQYIKDNKHTAHTAHTAQKYDDAWWNRKPSTQKTFAPTSGEVDSRYSFEHNNVSQDIESRDPTDAEFAKYVDDINREFPGSTDEYGMCIYVTRKGQVKEIPYTDVPDESLYDEAERAFFHPQFVITDDL